MSPTSPGVIPLTQPVPQPLRRFGKYYLVHKLAEGGMAEIYLAKQVGAEGFERDVVVKVMKEHLSSSREFVEMFLDEARLAARLHHPNIVQITDLGAADGRYFICMEYLAGEDVQSIIEESVRRGQQVPLQVAVKVILSACEGLEFAHGYSEGGRPLNLVHRDVSPSNIIVTYQGTVKVLDFGIAKASHGLRQTQPGTVKGKLGYMSPEQAQGEVLDGRADVFSLGVTLHELITGRRIFQKDSDISILMAMLQQPIPSPRDARPDVPAALEAIVMKAVAKQRDQRYASAAALRHDLESFLSSHFSMPGMSQLSAYMTSLFGEQQARLRTQVPSLKELTERGFVLATDLQKAPVTGFEETMVRGRSRAELIRTEVMGQRPITDATPAKSATGKWIAAISVAVLLLLGGAAGLIKAGHLHVPGLNIPGLTPTHTLVYAPPGGTVETATATTTVPEPPPATDTAVAAGDPGASTAPDTTTAEPAGSGTTEVAQGTGADVTAEPAATTEVVQRPRAILLGTKDVSAVLVKNRRAITACGERFRPQLPADGVVHVVVRILNTGAVGRAQVTPESVAGTDLGRCLKERMEAIRFPKNRNLPELEIDLPLRFNAQSG